MSSKIKPTATKAETKPALVPKLRFPEFRGKAGWKPRLLGSLFSQREEIGHTSLRLLSLMDKEGIIPQEDSNRKKSASGDLSKYLRVAPGDIVYNTMRMWEGRSALSNLEGIVSPAYTVCCPTSEASSLFFSYFFKTQKLIAEFARYSQGLVKDTLNLKFEAFACIAAAIPTLPEQQRIATCLSSLDDLISAQARKVDALKRHKKGLMQQLFPREGETQPRLRFPEFRGQGEWEAQPFEALFECKPNNTLSRDQLNYQDGSARNIHYGDIHTKYPTLFRIREETVPYINASVSISKFKPESYCKEGDLVFADASEDLADVGKSIELVDLNEEIVLAGSHTIHARQKSDVFRIGFLGFLFKGRSIRAQIEKEAQGTKVLQISASRLATIDVSYPTNKFEQLRIAECLSTLDALITAETRKLEGLKAHKKGLMQGLFPNPEK